MAAELGPDETRKLTGPILDIRASIETKKTIDAAEASQIAVQNAAATVEHNILQAINERARTSEPQPGGAGVDGDEINPPLPKPKPIRTLKVRGLSNATYLETAQDIDDFLGKLRTQLEQAVQSGERVRIE